MENNILINKTNEELVNIIFRKDAKEKELNTIIKNLSKNKDCYINKINKILSDTEELRLELINKIKTEKELKHQIEVLKQCKENLLSHLKSSIKRYNDLFEDFKEINDDYTTFIAEHKEQIKKLDWLIIILLLTNLITVCFMML